MDATGHCSWMFEQNLSLVDEVSETVDDRNLSRLSSDR